MIIIVFCRCIGIDSLLRLFVVSTIHEISKGTNKEFTFIHSSTLFLNSPEHKYVFRSKYLRMYSDFGD